jgi:3-oxoacyl-[acyl-carrier-protein] synthase-1
MTQSAVIAGVGMMTAVGLTAGETASSVRCAAMRFSESPLRDRRFAPYTLAEVPEGGLPPLSKGVESASGLTGRDRRMLRLAAGALRGMLESCPSALPAPALVLALPETETGLPLHGRRFLEHLGMQTQGAFDLARSDASDRGRAGGLAAIGQAIRLIAEGKAKSVVAGGVDSYRDGYVLATLDLEARVRSALNLDAFVPGEAAGFVLLADRRAADAAGARCMAQVSMAATGFEAGHLYSPEPYRGEGLAMAVSKLVQSGAVPAPFEEVYSSMNGESHWAKEWGVAAIRNKSFLAQGYRMHHPADCYGDVGAASGVLMVGLAAMGVRDGYRRSPCLIYGSSDRGPRAAVALTAV